MRVRVNAGVVARVSRGRCEKRLGPRVRPRGVRVAGGRNARVALRVVVAGDRHADVRASDQRKRVDAHDASERIGGCVVAVWGSARREETERRFFLDEPVSEGEPSHENARRFILGAAEKLRHLRGAKAGAYRGARGGRERTMGKKKRCHHGRLKTHCKVCSPCPHGRVKYSLHEYDPCPHGKLKHCRWTATVRTWQG